MTRLFWLSDEAWAAIDPLLPRGKPGKPRVDDRRVISEPLHTAFGRPAPAHLARHLLFRSLAYRLQADRLGDLDRESQRLLDRSGSPEKAGRTAVDLSRQTTELRPGTILGREWNGQMQQVAVLADGFAWNGNTYPSLSKAAFAITGTRWNGPKFFGLRDKSAKAP